MKDSANYLDHINGKKRTCLAIDKVFINSFGDLFYVLFFFFFFPSISNSSLNFV